MNHNTVERLTGMLEEKWLLLPKKYRSLKGELIQAAPHQRRRQFKAQSANQKWVTDVMKTHVAGEKPYLSSVLDLYNRGIIAFETSRHPAFELVNSMLKKALDDDLALLFRVAHAGR